jgi:succinyl-CoA synthetase beta subunit
MKIHEYQARQILADNGVPVPPAEVVRSPVEAAAAFNQFGQPVCVVKAQVYAGGRGKAGFVKLVKSPEEALDAAKFMLTHRMVGPQTGAEGVPVSLLIVAPGVEIAKEYYLGMTVDRDRGTATMIASAEGGVEIEEVARKTPQKVFKEPLHPMLGLQGFQARELAFKLGFRDKLAAEASRLMSNLAKVFFKTDASLVEVNPLVVTKDGKLLAIDAKINFDDNALFRHNDILAMADQSQEKPLDLRAQQANLNYIALDGAIGCLVNGAGLAMAPMDIIKYAGGSPANFLDVGGGANADQIKNAFRILLSDKAVRAVLINIFGGILRCDTLATGVVAAAHELAIKVPIVVRMEGTNVDLGRKILLESGFNFTVADGMRDAAEKVVALVAQGKSA